MSIAYTILGFAEVLVLFASFIALMIFIVRAMVRSITAPKEPPPKKEDLRHLKRAGQSDFY